MCGPCLYSFACFSRPGGKVLRMSEPAAAQVTPSFSSNAPSASSPSPLKPPREINRHSQRHNRSTPSETRTKLGGRDKGTASDMRAEAKAEAEAEAEAEARTQRQRLTRDEVALARSGRLEREGAFPKGIQDIPTPSPQKSVRNDYKLSGQIHRQFLSGVCTVPRPSAPQRRLYRSASAASASGQGS